MKIYKARTLFSGMVIGRGNKKFVGVPGAMTYKSHEDFAKEKGFIVEYQGTQMKIEDWYKAESFRKFEDRSGRGSYTLAYFEWQPTIQQVKMWDN